MIKMMTIRPTPPLGAYPQLRLCGHVGNAPNKIKIKTISRIVDREIMIGRLN